MNQKFQKKGYLMEDFRLFHLLDVQGTKIDYHYHDFYKILFLVSGTGGYSIEGKKYLLKSGDIVFIDRHAAHRPEFEPGVAYERVIIYLSTEFLERQSTGDCNLTDIFDQNPGPIFRPNEKERKQLISLIAALEQELSGTNFGKTIMSNSIILRILIELFRSLKGGRGQNPEPVLPKNKRILDIVRYLDVHLTEQISIEKLSEIFYMSRFHMMRSFKEETGTTIHNYISDRRLLMARDLIGKGYAATEACFMCGFQSYASFSRAYGKLFGHTPTGRGMDKQDREGSFE